MTDDEFRDLVERHRIIEDLTTTPGWAYLADYMTAQIAAKNRALLNGNAKTIEDYRGMAGWIQGAQAVLTASETLGDQINREEQRRREQAA